LGIDPVEIDGKKSILLILEKSAENSALFKVFPVAAVFQNLIPIKYPCKKI